MSKTILWTIEDNIVALYLALHGEKELNYSSKEIEEIISNSLLPKKGFNMRVDNYRYIITEGKEGLSAGYPEGFDKYKQLYELFKDFNTDQFKEYVNIILDNRRTMMISPKVSKP